MKNVTLSLPDDLLRKSREYAEKQGISLNEMIRRILKQQVQSERKDAVDKLIDHSRTFRVQTKKWKWNRDEIYDRKIFS
ncbi:MAG: ribbon-helix-helix protein, CopG family [Saprospirales bacterium]|nr:ribbon-helix-helix protein, CopG family [Saprospirales bacterium]MBK8924126.1 ribbon-helix-helix protein, CopG family [Saprospirales bacterium]